jgi:hypothetical protein
MILVSVLFQYSLILITPISAGNILYQRAISYISRQYPISAGNILYQQAISYISRQYPISDLPELSVDIAVRKPPTVNN